MEFDKNLKNYLNRDEFKDALGIPKNYNITYKKLAQGEYNINYILLHPITNKKMILRINTGSQMHLNNQIEYEFNALKLLEKSNRTPKPIFIDGSKEYLDYGLMVMEFLEGRSLNYKTDLNLAAECLADIHATIVSENSGLIYPKNPIEAILFECNEMFKIYYDSRLSKKEVKSKIKRLLSLGEKKLKDENEYSGYRCCVNTELNSGNFLINGHNRNNYLVDWEKPILSTPIQDLGHFLAPTTTFWKTDIILSKEENEKFVNEYINAVNNRFVINNLNEQLNLFIAINCLRGITWCSMAYIQYNSYDKLIKNGDTYKKLEAYLEKSFLEYIENMYFK
ncbi:aminoglycoside phosphotransferase family protein [Miniphocaeibacter massiliensis]|uniref:aminoglycoside phosphotransferase family protein n=1 Tax=Miniphocaeibacter massiliensis TaxID=2041841 RepID=UPI000C087B68|nr:aminoglycoside phosphotransferase family protein [Miniphocaeibacter massiliensis]